MPGLVPAGTTDSRRMAQVDWRMHSGAFIPMVSPHPSTSIGTMA